MIRYYLYFSETGEWQGGGATNDGTFPPGAVECSKEQHDAAAEHARLVDSEIVFGQPKLYPAIEARAALHAGFLAEFGDFSAIYSCDDEVLFLDWAEAQTAKLDGKFSDGTETIQVVDMTGTIHSMAVDQFMKLEAARRVYARTLKNIIASGAGKIPRSPVKIE